MLRLAIIQPTYILYVVKQVNNFSKIDWISVENKGALRLVTA